MKKKLFYAVVAIGMLASCAENEYVGEVSPNLATDGTDAIVFNSGAKKVTRSGEIYGADAAELLNKTFVVEGIKTVSGTGKEVFDNYNVSWGYNTANTTASNTANWEYVGVAKNANSAAAEQTIKYWDFAASQYDFWAYSLGGGSATVSSLEPNAAALGTSAYTITGDKVALSKVYISDLVTAYNPVKSVSGVADDKTPPFTMGNEVDLVFRSLVTKARVGLYETVPGYSIKNVLFYPAADGTPAATATLYASDNVLPSFPTSGTSTYTVTFPTIGKDNIGNSDYNKAHVTFPTTGVKASSLDFGGLSYGAKHKYEKSTGDIWLGINSTTPTWAKETSATAGDYSIIMPNETGAVLTLKVDYTLESTDGSGEEITVYGATALVPSQYTQWKPNYAYTYLFKISDNTNGLTNKTNTDKEGLYPITLDAIVIAPEDGTQETITTVSTPSITTYSLTSNVTANNEYSTTDEIYATTTENGTLITMSSTNAWLYSLSGKGSDYIYTEAEVLEALTKYSSNSTDIVGRNGITLTSQTVDLDDVELPLVDGNKITGLTAGQLAKFTCSTAGTYAFVYLKTAGTSDDKYEQIDLTGVTDVNGYYTYDSGTSTYTKIESTTTPDTGTKYYDKYFVVTGATYAIKVIRIK